MSWWIFCYIFFFFFRNIIELGSGTGLTGLTICATSSPCQYIFTDCHEKVLETLNHNLILNNNYYGRESPVTGENEMPRSMEQRTPVTQEGGSDEYSPVDGNCDRINKKQKALHLMHEGGPCLDQTGCNQSFLACRALPTDNNRFNMTGSDKGVINYYARKPLVNFHHKNEDFRLHSGKAHVSVCHLDWINNWKPDHFPRLQLGIILAAGK